MRRMNAQRVLFTCKVSRFFYFGIFFFSLNEELFLCTQIDNPDPEASPEEEKMEEETTTKINAPVADIDPAQDPVYHKTTSVVKSILELNTGVQIARPEEFVDLVKVCYFCDQFYGNHSSKSTKRSIPANFI